MPGTKTVAIIGRTNVGKSTLFNRLVEDSKAITSNQPGTTRDRNEAFIVWRGQEVKLIDTGGLDIDQQSEIEQRIIDQIKHASKTSDLLLLVVDGQGEPISPDREAVRFARQTGRPVLLVINKIDNQKQEHMLSPEYYRFGFDKPQIVSAKNGRCTGDLLDEIYSQVFSENNETHSREKPTVSVALIGKPNVGKSSLMNALAGEERSIVTPIPYTTRESHDITIPSGNDLICLIDTAGLRKRGKIRKAFRKTKTLEKDSETKTVDTIKRCDVALLVIDLSQPITVQDKRLAQLIIMNDKGLIVLANKMDLVPHSEPSEIKIIRKNIARSMPFLEWAPILIVSAKNHTGIKNIFSDVINVQEQRKKIIPAAELIDLITALANQKRPPLVTAQKNKTIRLTLEQIGTVPPSFQVSANVPGSLPDAYIRFVDKKLRATHGFAGTPLNIQFKKYRGKI